MVFIADINKTEEITKDALQDRLSNTTNHLRTAKTMVETGYDCSDVLIQLASVKAELADASMEFMKQHIKQLLQEAMEENNPEKIAEVNGLIKSFFT